MKIQAWAASLIIGVAIQATAQGQENILTAHIRADGTILRQAPHWISSVELQSQPNYFSQYKLSLVPDQVKREPRFCVASPIDATSYERQLHGQAKVLGAPRVSHVTVMTQLVDVVAASGDNRMEFMVMCSR